MTQNLKELKIKVQFYKLATLLFAGMGFLVFFILYFKNIEGRLLEAFGEPRTILLILVPFLPAIILSLLTKSAQKKYINMISSSQNKDKP